MVAAPQKRSGEICLEQIEALRAEMGLGIAAISANALPNLEGSLWRQELLCVTLKHLVAEVQGTPPNPALMRRLQTAVTALQELNQTYAEVVRQAQAANHLLVKLCSSYRAPGLRDSSNAIGTHYSMEA